MNSVLKLPKYFNSSEKHASSFLERTGIKVVDFPNVENSLVNKSPFPSKSEETVYDLLN